MIKKTKKYIIYSIVLLLVLGISVGFSALQRQLLIDDSIFNVRLQEDTRVSANTVSKIGGNAVSNSEDYNVSKIYGSVTFPSTSSYVLYKVDLTNYGNVKTGLLSITSNTSGVNYQVCDSNGSNCTSNPKTSVCNGSNCTLGSTKSIYVKVTSTSTGTKNVDLDLNFQPYHTIGYENFQENTTSFQTEIMENDTYEVTLTSDVEEVSVTGDGFATYNKNNHKLTISAVTGNITVNAKYLATDIAETSYTGSNPNNYVRFNNTLFRIITKETIDDGYGNTDLRTKIIANTSIGNNIFDDSSNDFGVSSLAATLNTTYYTSIDETSKELIDTALWTEDYANNIGLIKSSDYESNSTWLNWDMYTLTKSSTTTSDYYKNNKDYLVTRTIISYDGDEPEVIKIAGSSGSGKPEKIYAINNGNLTDIFPTTQLATYPVTYLKENVLIVGGSGTSTNPYLLDLSDGGVQSNPTLIAGRNLTVTGSNQDLVTVSNKLGTPYYSTSTQLNSTNYSSSGSTTIPKASAVGNYTIYYYIPAIDGFKAKSGKVTSKINGHTYTITYTKGDNVSSIGKTSDSCTTTGSSLTCNVTLPTINANAGWTDAKWNYNSNQYNPGASFTLNSSNAGLNMVASALTQTYTITINAGNGISKVALSGWANSGTATMTNNLSAGSTLNLSEITPTYKDGYNGVTYTKTSGEGTISGNTFTVGSGIATITLNATTLASPSTPTISGGGTNVYGNARTLSCATSTNYASGTTKYYSFGYATSDGGTPSNWTTASYSATYNAPLTYTTRYYSCRVYASDGTLTSGTVASATASDQQVTYVNARIDFDATSNGGSISGTTPLYVPYNATNIYTTRTNTTTGSIPTASKTGYTFAGWYTSASGGTLVINSSGVVQASVSGWTDANKKWQKTSTSNTANTNRLYAQFTGNTYTATFHYNSNATSGSFTDATTTASCTVSSGSTCTVSVPSVVSSSVGKYNSAYKGVTTSTGSMGSTSLELSASATYYANYSSALTIYYPKSDNTITSNATALYRNEYYSSSTAMTTITATLQDSTDQATTVTLSNLKGTFAGLNATVNSATYYALNNSNVKNTDATTFYTISTFNEDVTFKYNNNTTCASATVASTSSSVASRYYCTSISAQGTWHNSTTTVPTDVTNSKGQYNSNYRAMAAVNSLSAVVSFKGGSTYYAVYSSEVTNYYYSTEYTNRTLYRNEYLASASATTYTSVIADSNDSKTNYTTATGPNSSTWYGLADTATATRKYSSVAAAATSNTCTLNLYTVYQYAVTYTKGANVSEIGATSGSCRFKHGDTSCNVTLPTITANAGYVSVGWNTTLGATTGSAPGSSYSLTSNGTTLYANTVEANYSFGGRIDDYIPTGDNDIIVGYYLTLADAYNAYVNYNDNYLYFPTIKVLRNVTDSSALTVTTGTDGWHYLNINFEGYTVDRGASPITISSGAWLSIGGVSNEIETNLWSTTTGYTFDSNTGGLTGTSNVIINNGTFEMSGAKIVSTGDSVLVQNGASSRSSIQNGAKISTAFNDSTFSTITLNNGTMTIYGTSSSNLNITNDATISVNSGADTPTFIGGKIPAITMESGTLNVNGGVIRSGATIAIKENGGTINFNDGVIMGGTRDFSVNNGEININGGKIYGAVRCIDQFNGTINITDGEFTTKNGYGYYISDGSGEVSGGTWNINSTIFKHEGGDVIVTGGTFSTIDGYGYDISDGTSEISGGAWTSNANFTLFNNRGGTLTLTGNTNASSTKHTIYTNGGSTIISGGTYTSNTTHTVTQEAGTTTISGGTITTGSTNYYIIWLQDGNLNIDNDALIYGSSTCLGIAGGEARISGGSLSSSGGNGINMTAGKLHVLGGRVSSTSHALHVCDTDTTCDATTYLYGGTLTSSGSYPTVWTSNTAGVMYVYGNVLIEYTGSTSTYALVRNTTTGNTYIYGSAHIYAKGNSIPLYAAGHVYISSNISWSDGTTTYSTNNGVIMASQSSYVIRGVSLDFGNANISSNYDSYGPDLYTSSTKPLYTTGGIWYYSGRIWSKCTSTSCNDGGGSFNKTLYATSSSGTKTFNLSNNTSFSVPYTYYISGTRH